MKKTILCTLYNSVYLDKGLVLYDSFCECTKDFKLYVLCMDERCYEVLSDINADNMIPIRLEDFEDDDLLKIKPTRSFGEYCWTCTPSIILYVIEKYNESICTYIDADMYFYSNPQVLIDDMINAGKSVMIVPHRFTKVNKYLEANGAYCVEFNTFINQEDSLKVLKQWREDCIECCTANNDGVHFGDQKYLDSWPEKYECVYVCPHLGAGVAPWNIQSYRMSDKEWNAGVVYNLTRKMDVKLIFYHFQNITYLNDNMVNINTFSNKLFVDYRLVRCLYLEYLSKITEKRKWLSNQYSILFLIRSHPAFCVKRRSLFERIRKITLKKLLDKMIMYYNKRKDLIVLN